MRNGDKGSVKINSVCSRILEVEKNGFKLQFVVETSFSLIRRTGIQPVMRKRRLPHGLKKDRNDRTDETVLTKL
jgi:hypothetical protein